MLGNLFHLTNLHLEYFDGYIYAGVTPMYVAPLTAVSAPNARDHSLPMNGAFEDKNWYSSGHYRHPEVYHDVHHQHYYDNVVEEDALYGHRADFYDYGGPRYYDNHDEDRGVEFNGHDYFFI